MDQIHEDLKPTSVQKLANQPVDYELPGMGQFYCLQCARHFVDEHTLVAHRKSKVHKRRVKQLSETPYTQKEADAAAGLGTYTRPSKVEVNNSSVMEVREESTMQIGGESKDAASHADVEEKQEAPPTLDDIPEPKDKEASMDTAQ